MTAGNGVSLPLAAKGTYTVAAAAPSVGSFTMPASAWNQSFIFPYSDPDGAPDLRQATSSFGLIATTLAFSCLARCARAR